MVGSALVRRLECDDTLELLLRTRDELDLARQAEVELFFKQQQVDEVYLAAAKVGGIHANDRYPANFIYENLILECNVIHSAYRAGVKKLLLLGSSCIYPRLAEQPIKESELLNGKLEPTNEPYAIAKIAGIKLCESYNRQYGTDFRSVMPANLYGPNDNFHPSNSHVIPAMMRRFHQAKLDRCAQVAVWGSGKPMREFLHVDDLADASVFLMELAEKKFRAVVTQRLSHINIGTGVDCTIGDLAQTLAEVVGFTGELIFDRDKPDGAPRKLMDVSRLSSLGWRASISLQQGLRQTYDWFLQHQIQLRGTE